MERPCYSSRVAVTCPMINFTLREHGTRGYPPTDCEVLSFLRKGPSKNAKATILNTPRVKKMSSLRTPARETKQPQELDEVDEKFWESMVTTVWDHSLATGLLRASFEIRRLRPLSMERQMLIRTICVLVKRSDSRRYG